MSHFPFPSIALSVGLLLSIFTSQALPTTIEYEALNVTPGQDLWQYNYFVSGTTFAVNEDFTIFFDYHNFSNLQNPQPTVSSDWNVIDLQPDLNLPDNGAYDALALVDNPSLTTTFQVQFDWLGSGTPGSQPFSINQFDSAGNLVAVVETGNTVPVTSTVPEPGAGLLFIAGIGALLLLRRAPRRSAWLVALLALACVASLSAQQFKVVSRNLVSSTRFSRTQFDYTYTITVQNTGAAANAVTATVASSSPNTLVIMGNLSLEMFRLARR
ncbi:MAG TPA: PEP-CTERM sorting domain-containing protein [Bryobacteraceae bacterium]|nr:PEP-CTERM sorting domain-containing protein [Bryobacteraceae bacterium]